MRLKIPTPKGLPPAYHPYEGDGPKCAYCELPRTVHLVVQPLPKKRS